VQTRSTSAAFKARRSHLSLRTTNSPVNRIGRLALPGFLLAIALLAVACNRGSVVSVKLMPDSDQTLEPGKALPISATLSNDLAGKGVRWNLTGAGALVAQTPTSVMYQAPPNFIEGMSVTVTATPIADGRKAVTLRIILVPLKQTTSANKIHKKQFGEGA
jgi:hypothetical protein